MTQSVTSIPEDTPVQPASDDSLFARLGGIYGISAAVDNLVDRLYVNGAANANPKVDEFHQQQGHAGFKFLVTAWSIEETGGPKIYPGRDMRESHAHLSVTEREFDIVATEIKTSLYQLNVPEREFDEFMELIESYRSMVVAPEHRHAAE
ncbi:group I truncated hemoglobin [Profundibacterium mesophilum]|uniref:Group 1 hemoglobin glbN n=1 Tax=Profundibacterium mesophilum KAUST100406-0324 TaxID=1037889 RepID=A0A921TFJ8_9RHOB|nr:group 1 truncated hemoglobin [Profundibacterium mesophilum]KAF0676514.1 Group 1 hemoglobin glbN [Profundibacterium mesophilum KAUST100406-0324]